MKFDNFTYKYYCTGDCNRRDHKDYFRYGFIAAGDIRPSGHSFGKELRRLKKGDIFFAYLKGHGYIGYGIVLEEAVRIDDFVVEGYPGKKLYALPDVHEGLKLDHDNEKTEYIAKVKWIKTFCDAEAKKFPGMFCSRNVVCNLYDKHAETIRFLEKEFGIAEGKE